MKELVIFDLDGTLLNTIADLAISTNYALHRCGFPKHREEEYFHFVGNGITKLFERALPEECRSSDNVSRVRSYFLEYYSVIRSIRAIEGSDVCILMLDATRGIESQDLNIFSLKIGRAHV